MTVDCLHFLSRTKGMGSLLGIDQGLGAAELLT